MKQAIIEADTYPTKALDTTTSEPKQPAEKPERPRKIAAELQNQLLQEMIWVEGGSFEMGSRLATAANREKPAHQVTLDGFKLITESLGNRDSRPYIALKGDIPVDEWVVEL